MEAATVIRKVNVCKISKSVQDLGRVQLQDHCILCLRKASLDNSWDSFATPANTGDHLLFVPKAVATPGLLSTFNFIWPFLLNHLLDFNEILVNPEKIFKRTTLSKVATLDDLPPICQFCARDILKVEELLRAVTLQLQVLQKIIKDSQTNGQFSWRLEQFEKNLQESNADQQEIQFTLEFINGIGVSLEPQNDSREKIEDGTPDLGECLNPSEFLEPVKVEEDEDDHDDDDDPDYIKSEPEDSYDEELLSSEEEFNLEAGNLVNSDNSSDPLAFGEPPPVKKKYSRKNKAVVKKATVHGRKLQQTCNVCGIKFPFLKIFQHVQSHVGDYAVRCPNHPCPVVYSNTVTLAKLHYHNCIYAISEEQKKKQTHVCETCGFTTKNRQALRGHLQRSHERASKKNFPCPIAPCEKRFSVRQSVDFHLSHHDSSRPQNLQKCELCEKRIGVKDMRPHLNQSHQIQDGDILRCAHCPCLFSTRQALMIHLFLHRYQGLSCDLCQNGVTYYRHSDLLEHYTKEHQITWTKYICDGCGKDFFSKDSLSTHKVATCSKGHPSGRQKHPRKFPCDLCDGSALFTNEPGLVSHKIRVHGEEPFRCAWCQETFTYRGKLSRHEKTHVGIPVPKKEFKCEVGECGKVFKRKDGLDRHMVYHGVGGETCDRCGKTFGNADGLKKHRDAVHLGIRPHVCETCGERFTSGTALKRHNLIHTGERPFACDFCGQRFRHREVLKTHVESHERKGDAFKPTGPMKHVRKRKAQ